MHLNQYLPFLMCRQYTLSANTPCPGINEPVQEWSELVTGTTADTSVHAYTSVHVTTGVLLQDASSGFTIDFSVHQGLIAKCPNFHRDERKMCNNVQPYVLYGDPEFGCQRYYWCTPDKGICMQECEQSGGTRSSGSTTGCVTCMLDEVWLMKFIQPLETPLATVHGLEASCAAGCVMWLPWQYYTPTLNVAVLSKCP